MTPPRAVWRGPSAAAANLGRKLFALLMLSLGSTCAPARGLLAVYVRAALNVESSSGLHLQCLITNLANNAG